MKKPFKNYTIRASVTEGGERIWLSVETTAEGKYFYESAFITAPNFIERFLGVTWQDKLRAKKYMLLYTLTQKIPKVTTSPLQKEVNRFLETEKKR